VFSWDEFYEVGLGILSINRTEFMLMTPRELEMAHSGYRKRKEEDWEMVRYGSYYSMILHAKKDSLELKDVFIPPDSIGKKRKTLTPDMMMKVTKIKKEDG
jgi:hypothetical protein